MQTAFRSVLAATVAFILMSLAGPLSAGVPGAVMISVQPPIVGDRLLAEPSLDTLVAEQLRHPARLDRQTLCMAKAVHHEAANQSLEGQLAVAQLILNRTRAAGFPKTICGVVDQHGQFVHITRYRIPRKDPRWAVAVAVARIAEEGVMAPEAPGALFFHAAYVHPDWRGRGRVRVVRIGEHIFYR